MQEYKASLDAECAGTPSHSTAGPSKNLVLHLLTAARHGCSTTGVREWPPESVRSRHVRTVNPCMEKIDTCHLLLFACEGFGGCQVFHSKYPGLHHSQCSSE